ncbi:hypothetical protein [Bradyrhizobium sp. 62]|uniref:hypothetical protein n=1 Tax=Bradyrhizobium sp. 62 TaxID=1043588 RepID=UPI001FF78710|nr:hypothetical protein [Bradyrhizobium sp. 62]MCK1367659.1 hypothetical protein [Bradyrhizobium sp. 62]
MQQQLPASNVREINAAAFRGPFYIVVCGLSKDDPYTPERNIGDTTWAGTVKDIADMQFENLLQVIELGTGRDVTDRMVREAAELRIHDGADYSHKFFELVELHIGTRTARSLVRVTA